MPKPKLIRITTVPISLEKLLEGQLSFMQQYFQVTAVSAEQERLQNFGKNNDVDIFSLEMTRQITPFQDLKALIKLVSYLKKERPQIVHTHTPKAGIVGMLAARLAGVPIRLHTVAGLPLMETTGKKRWLLDNVEKLTYRCATRVYPNSKGLYDFILEQKFTTPNKLQIIAGGSSNGINTQYFNPELFSSTENLKLRNALNIKVTDFVFVFVGRLVSDKGINELVSAFSNSKFKIQNSKLLLVGPLETELDPLKEETLQEIKTNPHIISVGYQNDVRPYFSISDALVFPSYREGFPNVVLQAGAMGLPSIVSDINGCNEIIREKENGLIVPPKNTDTLKQAMQQIEQDETLRTKLQRNAREMIVDRFEQTVLWEALLNEYQTLLKNQNTN